MEPICLECGSATEQTPPGRPRLYCSNGCRQAAHRRRHSLNGLFPADGLEAVGREDGKLPLAAPTVDQVACAILDARAISSASTGSVAVLVVYENRWVAALDAAESR